MSVTDETSEQVIVVVPTYNEAENIDALAESVLNAFPGIELLIVDDDSPDGTGSIADQDSFARASLSRYASHQEPRLRTLLARGSRMVPR